MELKLKNLFELVANGIGSEQLNDNLNMQTLNSFLRSQGFKIKGADGARNVSYRRGEDMFKLSLNELKKGGISVVNDDTGAISMEDFTDGLRGLEYARTVSNNYVSMVERSEVLKPSKSNEEVLILSVKKLANKLDDNASDFQREDFASQYAAVMADYAIKEGGFDENKLTGVVTKLEEILDKKNLQVVVPKVGTQFKRDDHFMGAEQKEGGTVEKIYTLGLRDESRFYDKPIISVESKEKMTETVVKELKNRVANLRFKFDFLVGDQKEYDAVRNCIKELADEYESVLKFDYSKVGISAQDLRRMVGAEIAVVEKEVVKGKPLAEEKSEVKERVSSEPVKKEVGSMVDNKVSSEKGEVPRGREGPDDKREVRIDVPERKKRGRAGAAIRSGVESEQNNSISTTKNNASINLGAEKGTGFKYSEEDYVRENIQCAARYIDSTEMSQEQLGAVMRWRKSIAERSPVEIINKIKGERNCSVLTKVEFYSTDQNKRERLVAEKIALYKKGKLDDVWGEYFEKIGASDLSVEEVLGKVESLSLNKKDSETAKVMILLSNNPSAYKEVAGKEKGMLWQTCVLGNFNTDTYQTINELCSEQLKYGDILKNRADILTYLKSLTFEGVELDGDQEKHVEILQKSFSDGPITKQELHSRASKMLESLRKRQSLPEPQRLFVDEYEEKVAKMEEIAKDLGGIVVDVDSEEAKRSAGGELGVAAENSVVVDESNIRDQGERVVNAKKAGLLSVEEKNMSVSGAANDLQMKYDLEKQNVEEKNARVAELEKSLKKKSRLLPIPIGID